MTGFHVLYGNLIFCNAHSFSFDLYLPLDISVRFYLNIFCSFFASSSFVPPDFYISESFISFSKSLNLFLAVFPLKWYIKSSKFVSSANSIISSNLSLTSSSNISLWNKILLSKTHLPFFY